MYLGQNYVVTLKPIEFFRQSEEVDFEAVWYLSDKIRQDGRWLEPIIGESQSGFIMDGNHRYRAAKMLKLNYLPCILLAYSDPRVEVFDWNTDERFDQVCMENAIKSERVFPYKTTRHIFSPVPPTVDIEIGHLR